jgi:hypothetical protein
MWRWTYKIPGFGLSGARNYTQYDVDDLTLNVDPRYRCAVALWTPNCMRESICVVKHKMAVFHVWDWTCEGLKIALEGFINFKKAP